ncbi:MAG: hypothetical protein ACOX4A_02705 [Saccharofermentanales bacterium]
MDGSAVVEVTDVTGSLSHAQDNIAIAPTEKRSANRTANIRADLIAI